MASVTVELVSVERMMWHGEASIVVAQTTEGEIGVLPGHEPMLAELGESGVRPIEGNALVAAVQGGFLSVAKDKVTVLAEYAVWADEVDADAAQAMLDTDDESLHARGAAELMAIRRSSQS